MKRGKLMLTVLVVLAMLFASCSSHLSEGDAEGGSSAKTVRVSLGVDVEDGAAQKTITTDTTLDGLTFWYKAIPQWDQSRPIHGGTKDGNGNYIFVLIPNYTAGDESNIGSFTAGEWIFYVEVRKGDDVIYSGDSGTYYVYSDHASPVVTVTTDARQGSVGGISITVQAPSTSGNVQNAKERLEVICSEGSVTMTRTGYDNGLVTFTGSRNNLPPGAYTFSLRYIDEDETRTDVVSQAVTIFAGTTSYISGLIDGGTWHSSQITINAPGITEFTFEAANRATSVAKSTPLTYTAYAKSTQGIDGHPIKFIFYTGVADQEVQGVLENGKYKATYNFQSTTYGMYDVTCAAIDTAAGVTESLSLYVEVGNKVNLPQQAPANGTVTMGIAQTVFAPGDTVPLNVKATSKGAYIGKVTVVGVDASNIQTDGIYETASFIMPSTDAAVSVTFERVHFKYSAHGSVTTATPNAAKDDTVSLTVNPENGYQLNTLTIIDCDGNSVQYDANNYSFTMPTKAVTVSATFKEANP